MLEDRPTTGIGAFPPEALRVRTLDIAGRAIELVSVRAPDALLDAIDPAEFARDERMPYWAELWPAAIGLARFLLEGGGGARGADVLELGAGLGLGGIAAALAGARAVVCTDYFEEALLFARENARRNGAGAIEARLLDWRAPALGGHGGESPPAKGRTFPVIVGSDLLYEKRNAEPLCGAIAALLSGGGSAWIADPGRPTASAFAAVAEEHGLSIDRAAEMVIDRSRVTIWRLALR